MGSSITTMTPFLYVLELQCAGLHAVVRLNDVKISEYFPDAQVIVQIKLNQWIVEGENVLTLLVAAAAPALQTPDRHLLAYLFMGLHGKQPDAEAAAATFDPSGNLQFKAEPPTKVWEHKFIGNPAFGRWAWEDADSVRIQPSHQAEIATLLNSIRGALNSREGATLVQLFSIRITETSRALGISEARAKDNFSRAMEAWQAPQAPLAPISIAELDFDSGAQFRVVAVSRKDRNPLIAASKSGSFSENTLYVSRIHDSWWVIR